MKRIGLFGIGGVYNFGCEAIVRGASQLIKQVYIDSVIKYYSFNYEYDKKMLTDLDVEVIEVRTHRTFLDRAINKSYKLLNKEHRVLNFDYIKIIGEIDELWSIGGDIYTIPEIIRKQPKYEYYNWLVDFCNRVIEHGKRVVLYGASIGPFGDYGKAKKYYFGHLRKYEMILCRERVSQNYLLSNGINNVCFFPDPAFGVHDSKETERGKERYIGINLSPLAFCELYGHYSEENKQRMARLVEKMIDKFNYKVLMIPHVVSDYENDDDLRFQNGIIACIDEKYKDCVKLADYSQGFLGIKRQLRECVLVVSARMHCAINSIVENIPTIMIAYSSKSRGMIEYVYGNDEWIVDLKDCEKDLVGIAERMWSSKESVAEYLNRRNSEIEKEYNELIEHLVWDD